MDQENQMFEGQNNNMNEQDKVQKQTPKRKKGLGKAITFIVLVILIVAAVSGAYKFMKGGLTGSGYYAVFLDNNQVYFGNLSNKRSTYVVLEDVYYLRVTQVLQTNEQGQQVAVPDINLIKLGTELHKPVDRMEIQKEHILFIEKLEDDSNIIQAIETYETQQEAEESEK